MVRILYLAAYLNLVLFAPYFFIMIFGTDTEIPGYADLGLSAFYTVIMWPVIPLTLLFGLYARNEFDLLRMQDGTSAPSRFIWCALSGALSVMMLYTFFLNLFQSTGN